MPEGFRSLYNGVTSPAGRSTPAAKHWKTLDWRLDFDGVGRASGPRRFRDSVADWRWNGLEGRDSDRSSNPTAPTGRRARRRVTVEIEERDSGLPAQLEPGEHLAWPAAAASLQPRIDARRDPERRDSAEERRQTGGRMEPIPDPLVGESERASQRRACPGGLPPPACRRPARSGSSLRLRHLFRPIVADD